MAPLVRRSIAQLAFPLSVAGIVAASACGSDSTTSPLTPAAIARVSADSQTTSVGVAMSQPLIVLVTGGGGAPLANASVVWTVGDGGGTLSDTTVVSDAEGHAATTYTPGQTPGLAHVTARTGSLAAAFTITLVVGAATSLEKFGSDNPAAIVGSVLPLSVKLEDAYGNGIAGATVTWSATGGSISATTSTTDSGGVATVTYTASSAAGTSTLTASVNGIAPATFTITTIGGS
jgi:adhesin/invasin